MPRYRTISRWLDKETGNYVDPPAEVELDKERGESLVRAGCVVPVSESGGTKFNSVSVEASDPKALEKQVRESLRKESLRRTGTPAKKASTSKKGRS